MRKLAFVALWVLASCASNATYGYQYQLTQQFTGGEDPEQPAVEARQLLGNAKTVAFFPPDSCLNADTHIASRQIQELRAHCGVLMSTLERAAERAGYEVLSWQNLRGGRAIDFAREGKVDVLFEVNEFEITALTDDAVQRRLRFFESHEDGTETPLMVPQQVGSTCAGYEKSHHAARTVAATGSIDIKTVDVTDGRDRWHYRKTREKQYSGDYPRITFTGKGKHHPAFRGLLTLGIVGVAVGVELAVLSSLIKDDPTTPTIVEGFDPSPWQYVSIIGGLAALGGAIAVHYQLPVKPPAERVLCDDKFRDNRTVVQVGTLSAEHTFEETKTADLSKEEFEALRDEMIGDFVKILTEVHGAKR